MAMLFYSALMFKKVLDFFGKVLYNEYTDNNLKMGDSPKRRIQNEVSILW